jgi:CCR4-NOT transcriptional regulation complex NOT5 subunit
MEQKPINTNNYNQKEKNCTLQNLISKINKTEPSTFGNYYVNFNEMFQKEEDYKDYFKKHVSLFNDDLVNKDKYTGTINSFLQPKFFDNFHESTLFYIFYYLTRDTLQLFAGQHLYKKGWKYNYKFQIWFKQSKDKDGNEKWEFFNPLEWKKNDYIYGPVDTQNFLTEDEAKQYLKQFENDNNKKDKRKQGQKSGSSSSGQNNNSSGNQQSTKQSNNNA